MLVDCVLKAARLAARRPSSWRTFPRAHFSTSRFLNSKFIYLGNLPRDVRGAAEIKDLISTSSYGNLKRINYSPTEKFANVEFKDQEDAKGFYGLIQKNDFLLYGERIIGMLLEEPSHFPINAYPTNTLHVNLKAKGLENSKSPEDILPFFTKHGSTPEISFNSGPLGRYANAVFPSTREAVSFLDAYREETHILNKFEQKKRPHICFAPNLDLRQPRNPTTIVYFIGPETMSKSHVEEYFRYFEKQIISIRFCPPTEDRRLKEGHIRCKDVETATNILKLQAAFGDEVFIDYADFRPTKGQRRALIKKAKHTPKTRQALHILDWTARDKLSSARPTRVHVNEITPKVSLEALTRLADQSGAHEGIQLLEATKGRPYASVKFNTPEAAAVFYNKIKQQSSTIEGVKVKPVMCEPEKVDTEQLEAKEAARLRQSRRAINRAETEKSEAAKREANENPSAPPTIVYIENLKFSTRFEEIQELAEKYGSVKSITMPRINDSPGGFANVEFDSGSDAAAFMYAMRTTYREFKGRFLIVRFVAEHQTERFSRAQDSNPSNTLFITGFQGHANVKDIEDSIYKLGVSASVFAGNSTTSRPFAHVRFCNAEKASLVHDEYKRNPLTIGGVPLSVRYAAGPQRTLRTKPPTNALYFFNAPSKEMVAEVVKNWESKIKSIHFLPTREGRTSVAGHINCHDDTAANAILEGCKDSLFLEYRDGARSQL